jgi:hypothetical protein
LNATLIHALSLSLSSPKFYLWFSVMGFVWFGLLFRV